MSIVIGWPCCPAIGQTQHWEPVVSPLFAETYAAVRERESFNDARGEIIVGQVLDDLWFEERAEAVIPRIRAYLTATLLVGESGVEHPALLWWRESLEREPGVVAAGLAQLGTKYFTYWVSKWEGASVEYIPEYRLLLVRCHLEALRAVEQAAHVLQKEVDAFEKVSPFAPMGYPFRTAPRSVLEPDLREEYLERLAVVERQHRVRARLRRLLGSPGAIGHDARSGLHGLYDGAEQVEYERLARLIVEGEYLDLQYVADLRKSLPELDKSLNGLLDDGD